VATHGEKRWPPAGRFDGRLRGAFHGHRQQCTAGTARASWACPLEGPTSMPASAPPRTTVTAMPAITRFILLPLRLQSARTPSTEDPTRRSRMQDAHIGFVGRRSWRALGLRSLTPPTAVECMLGFRRIPGVLPTPPGCVSQRRSKDGCSGGQVAGCPGCRPGSRDGSPVRCCGNRRLPREWEAPFDGVRPQHVPAGVALAARFRPPSPPRSPLGVLSYGLSPTSLQMVGAGSYARAGIRPIARSRTPSGPGWILRRAVGPTRMMWSASSADQATRPVDYGTRGTITSRSGNPTGRTVRDRAACYAQFAGDARSGPDAATRRAARRASPVSVSALTAADDDGSPAQRAARPALTVFALTARCPLPRRGRLGGGARLASPSRRASTTRASGHGSCRSRLPRRGTRESLLRLLEVALQRLRELAAVTPRACDEGAQILVQIACPLANIAPGVLAQLPQRLLGSVQRSIQPLERGRFLEPRAFPRGGRGGLLRWRHVNLLRPARGR